MEGKYAYAIQQRRKKDLQIIDIPSDDADPGNTGQLIPDVLNAPIEKGKKDFAKALKRANTPTKKQIWQRIFLLIPALFVAFSLVLTGAKIQSIQQSSPIVTVSFTSLTQQIILLPSNASFSASLFVSQVDPSTKIIPAYDLAYEDSLVSSQGTTTGIVSNCIAFCAQGVSQDDVDTLAKQTKPQLANNIRRDLQEQIEALGGMQSNSISFSVVSISSNPPVGQAGLQFTVAVVGSGYVQYVLTTDIAKLVLQLLKAQVQAGYQIMEQSPEMKDFAIGQNGNLSIKAGIWACYQFSQASLNRIHIALEGQSVTAAEKLLKKQAGVDPKSIHISGGGNLPDDFQHIKLSVQCPTNLPRIPLQ